MATLNSLNSELISNAKNLLVNPAAGPASALTAALPSPPRPYLKKVEGQGYYAKERKVQATAPLTGAQLKFTYCDVLDNAERPFGNLFSSLRLPVTPGERQQAAAFFAGTGLDGLQELEQVVVGEIPANTYGEMIDGKSITLKVPIDTGSGVQVYTLFSSYYGFNSDLNNQFSDTNTVSGLLGVAPTPDNDFNSNVAFLFCNDIARPRDTVSLTTIASGPVTIASRSSTAVTLALAAGTTYRSVAAASGQVRVKVRLPGLGVLDLADACENGQVGANGYFRLRQEATEILYFNESYAQVSVDSAVSRVDVTNSRYWSAWTPSNRFPNTPNGLGKVVASLRDASGQGVVDEPVGLVYLDKGLVVLTHPLLVHNLSRAGAQVVDPANPLATVAAAAAPAPFTQLHYPADTAGALASVAFRSVVTELTLTYTCMAQIGEFTKSTNATYELAYPEGSSNQPVYISEVGLYNRFGELMALGKTSQPVNKLPNKPSMFTVTLRA